ncbi:J domain-containing protein [Mycena indigotica]|uniref:J domain-containing protein n=1 Tax=Mycena indigotica TaxID=2126181 RepID=A0A8H6T2E2_9AGAR|nr:J domain-containing protein [Mycena indigotica]KAF7309615.1 J domain-containing protein [Mycena indigotica]
MDLNLEELLGVMAEYHYDEGGNLALYFLITVLALILTPLTLSSLPSRNAHSSTQPTPCQCEPCASQRLRMRPSPLRLPGKKVSFIVIGWSVFALACWKAASTKLDNKIYDPFEILGIRPGLTEKEIKSHFKKNEQAIVSRLFSCQHAICATHPDKVRVTANQTIEMIQDRFVGLTKAYKSLVDPVIRENLEKYGNPDGRQELSMGIALPAWLVAGQNNIYVLGAYALLIGGLLPVLVGRWWFGNRQKTKDGVNTRSAAAFFQNLTEDSTEADVVRILAAAYAFESVDTSKESTKGLENQIQATVGSSVWSNIVGVDVRQRRSMTLLYAYLLRIDAGKSLLKEQTALILQTPMLLNALLIIAQSRNWLTPTLAIMRLHAFFAQALPPAPAPPQHLAQLPNIKLEETSAYNFDYSAYAEKLKEDGDGRVTDVEKALGRWGRVEIVGTSFRVIGERIITPSSIVYLVVKLRVVPPGSPEPPKQEELEPDQAKRLNRAAEEREQAFLNSKREAEDLQAGQVFSGGAHAPFWPGTRKPHWWIVLADDKSNRIVVPSVKITDVPFRRSGDSTDFRSYKIQFQAPNTTGSLTWRVYVVSDSFVGEESSQDIVMKIDDVSALNADEQGEEDEISDPEEDTIAGQMAMMRGGSVKKIQEDEESDDESSTDDDESNDSSDSDSD